MQRGNLVVEVLALLVETAPAAGSDFRNRLLADVRALAKVRREFEQVQRAPRVAVRGGRNSLQGLVADRKAPTEAALLVEQSAAQHREQIILGERLEDIDARAGQQRVVELERGILCRRPDEGQRAVLDVGQEGVLLRLVEAMHLIEEQDRPAIAHVTVLFSLGYRAANVLDAGHDGRQGNEMRFGRSRNEARQGRLARAGRTPEDHRVRPALPDRPEQRLALVEQVPLAREFVERRRSHAIRQRPVRGAVRNSGEQVGQIAARLESQSSRRRPHPPRPAAAIAMPSSIPSASAPRSIQSPMR